MLTGHVAQVPQEVNASHDGAAAETATSGLLRFLNSYPNPLTRFTAPGGRARPLLRSLSGSTAASAPTPGGSSSSSKDDVETTAHGATATLSAGRATAPTYPLSTVIVVALIAFLIGSLLRSMLSPADFVYVVGDAKDVEQAGWREIRRLFELKYIVGGWDFQVALVRRQ